MHFDYPYKFCLSSLNKLTAVIIFLKSDNKTSKHSVIIGELCHNAWELLTAHTHIKVKQLLANFQGLQNKKGKYSLNEQVLRDVERSYDRWVVWLERRAATALTPRIWTRSVFDFRRSSLTADAAEYLVLLWLCHRICGLNFRPLG